MMVARRSLMNRGREFGIGERWTPVYPNSAGAGSLTLVISEEHEKVTSPKLFSQESLSVVL